MLGNVKVLIMKKLILMRGWVLEILFLEVLLNLICTTSEILSHYNTAASVCDLNNN